MKRREVLKIGVSVLSLTGMDRLVKALANQPTTVPIEPCVIVASTDEGYTPLLKCDGHVCPSGFFLHWIWSNLFGSPYLWSKL